MLSNEQIISIKERRSSILKENNDVSLTIEEQAIFYIYEDLQNIKKNFVDIAFRLNEANNYKYYEKFGYESIIDFSEHLFGFKKSSTYSFINIAQRFCSGMKLMPKYEKFSQSQLTEMCSLPEYLLNHVTSDMTIQDIRDYKKAYNSLTKIDNTYKQPKVLIEQYRNKTAQSLEQEESNAETFSRRPEEKTIKVDTPNKKFSTPKYMIQWNYGGEEHIYGYSNYDDVCKVVATFNDITCYRVIELKEIIEINCNSINLSEFVISQLKYGSGFENGKMRICHEYAKNPTISEFAKFLKEEYGLGGWNGCTHDDRGIELIERDKSNYDSILEKVNLSWNKVAKYIAKLIDCDNYLTKEEKIKFDNYQAQRYGSNEERIKAIVDWMVKKGTKCTWNGHYNNYNHDNNYQFVKEHLDDIQSELKNRKEVKKVSFAEIDGFNVWFNTEYCKKVNKE